MNKKNLIQTILDQLEKELASIIKSAKAAYEGATHEDAKAENKYDTRALEASYLAGAQSKRVQQIKDTILYFKQLTPQTFDEHTPISLTAYVELNCDGKKSAFFLAGHGGGLSFNFEGQNILVIGRQSSVAENLIGCNQGDIFEVTTKNGIKEYEIIFVA